MKPKKFKALERDEAEVDALINMLMMMLADSYRLSLLSNSTNSPIASSAFVMCSTEYA